MTSHIMKALQLAWSYTQEKILKANIVYSTSTLFAHLEISKYTVGYIKDLLYYPLVGRDEVLLLCIFEVGLVIIFVGPVDVLFF